MESISLVIVLLAALLTPLVMARLRISSIPTAVAELIVGIVLGKSFLNLIQISKPISELSSLGVIILIFLSGMEIDFTLFRPRKQPISNQTNPRFSVLSIAGLSYLSVIIVAFILAVGLNYLHLFNNIILATILFSTVALGIVIAALTEKELLSKPFGQAILLTAALGEIVPLLSLTVYSSLHSKSGSSNMWLLLLIFLVAILLLLNFRRPYQFFNQIDKTTTQLDIRLAFFIIVTLVTVAAQVGAESILGAFLAGMVMKLLRPREETREKLTSIGYGFFIPIFFIVTGAKLNLPKLLADRQSWALIPLFLLSFLLAKAAVMPIFRLRFLRKNAIAGAFLTSTTITLVLPILTVGENLKVLTAQQAGAFTIAAVLTCFIGPISFNRFYQPEKEDFKKTVVHFIGANVITVPIAQQLSKGRYDIKLYTNRENNYRTYNSEVNLELLSDLSKKTLEDSGAFTADIVVLGYINHDENFKLAQFAVSENVPRIIARFENKDVQNNQYDVLKDQGVEIYSTYDANISLLRSIIETPATMAILNDTQASIYEIVLRNRRFTGIQVKNLPFIDHITISQIYRDDHFIAPHGDTMLFLGDHLIFTGQKEYVTQIRQTLERLN